MKPERPDGLERAASRTASPEHAHASSTDASRAVDGETRALRRRMKELALLKGHLRRETDDRAAYVARLKSEIEAGSYVVDAARIADALIEESDELEAQERDADPREL